jgi:hypothetical protein
MSTNPEENLFTTIVEKMLAGHFICSYSDYIAYEQLERESYRDEISNYLEKIDRTLASTGNRRAYYAVYASIQSSERRRSIRSQFREVINDMEPLSRLLKLIMSSLSRDVSIQPGDVLRQSELLGALENSQPLVDDLALITRVGIFQTKKNSAVDHIIVILERLVEKGYLIHQTNSLLFTATGKWDYFYEVAEFIATHEKLDDEAAEEAQLEIPI